MNHGWLIILFFFAGAGLMALLIGVIAMLAIFLDALL